MRTYLHRFLFGTSLPSDKTLNIGWLLFRFYTGLSIALGAGWPKMKTGLAPGWFSEQVAGLGYTWPSPMFWAATASWGEFIGGLMIAFGLLTRFNAAQLAYQFFVVAFLWYEEPAPFVGMYYQQLLFWCFVIILFAGGGRYSLDTALRSRYIRGHVPDSPSLPLVGAAAPAH